jgi:hypothetical protein
MVDLLRAELSRTYLNHFAKNHNVIHLGYFCYLRLVIEQTCNNSQTILSLLVQLHQIVLRYIFGIDFIQNCNKSILNRIIFI